MAEKLKEQCNVNTDINYFRIQITFFLSLIFQQTLPVPATASVISHASPFDFDIDTHLLLSAVRML